jgi:dTDP-4-dehydrorhamnose reductase
VYGKTKSLGESLLPCVSNLRCSIIGPETKGFVSLLDWFRRQPRGAQLNGFSNHYWNGITTLQFARICQGVIDRELPLPHVQHVVPADHIAKADLLESFKLEWRRDDIAIKHIEVQPVVDRTLSTEDEELNRKLWQAAGYERPPAIETMVGELAGYDCQLAGALA